MRTVEMIERGNGEQDSIASRMQPGKIYEGVAFVLHIVQDSGGIRVDRNLIVIASYRSGKAQLICGILVEDD